MKNSAEVRVRSMGLAIFVFLFLALFPSLQAGILNRLVDGRGERVDAAADHYEYVGSNIVATGHVVIRMMGMELTADKAVINPETQDLEMKGNITFALQESEQKNLTIDEYNELRQDPFARVKVLEYVMSPSGKQTLKVDIIRNRTTMRAERLSGNMQTGVLQFRNFTMKTGILYCSGKEAERLFDGRISVRDTTFTTCEYLQDDHAHYSILTKKAIIDPRDSDRGVFNYNADQGEHSVWAFNNFIELFGIPCLWLPVLHKPSDLSAFGGRIEIGRSSSWGYYVRGAKNFQLLNDPYLNANLLLDFYSERGFGYGLGMDFMTEESSTELFFYGLHDRHPYYYWEDDDDYSSRWAENNSRLKIPKYRYEFRVANMTHLLPRLDFRGQVDVLSDYNLLDEFFNRRYESVLEPPTFTSLEYQHDRFTVSAYATVRVNSFFTTVQRLPEIRFDFQRQELFRNLYYQGETSFDYLSMRWREFDRDRTDPTLGENQNYSSFRFDTLHMFYYPLKVFNINLIPRAGLRLTAYSKSSKEKITYEDLGNMFSADAVDGQPTVSVKNYDSDGGSRLRVVGELGIEANTKFYRAWQEVKSAYWDLDGLRHVMQPYINYTFIPKTNVSADNLYYFDEIDRIEEQNVIRTGLLNRLQTRRNEQITELVSLEHYWDYYFHRASGFNSIGDLGTIFRFTPFSDLTFTSELLVDLGQNNAHDYRVTRGDRDVGRPGLHWKFVNRWNNQLSWQLAPDWRIFGSYLYSDQYDQRSPYSMGTMFSSVVATSMFINRFTRSQQVTAGIEFPLLFDKHLKGSLSCRYDIDAALMNDICLVLTRRFHCIKASVALGAQEKRGGADDGRTRSYYMSFFVSLADLPEAGFGYKRQ